MTDNLIPRGAPAAEPMYLSLPASGASAAGAASDAHLADEHPAARRLRLAFETKYGSYAPAFRAIQHWRHVFNEFQDSINRSRETPTTEADVDAAEREMFAALDAFAAGSRDTAETPATREDAALGAAIRLASLRLPDGFEIQVHIERQAAWVTMTNADADDIVCREDAERSLGREVEMAIADARTTADSGSAESAR